MFDFTWMSYYNSCPSVSGLFHLPQRALDPPTLFETIGFPSFYGWRTFPCVHAVNFSSALQLVLEIFPFLTIVSIDALDKANTDVSLTC